MNSDYDHCDHYGPSENFPAIFNFFYFRLIDCSKPKTRDVKVKKKRKEAEEETFRIK